MVSAIVIDWIIIPGVFFLVLILALSKFASFHNEEDTFLDQKS